MKDEETGEKEMKEKKSLKTISSRQSCKQKNNNNNKNCIIAVHWRKSMTKSSWIFTATLWLQTVQLEDKKT